MKKAGTRTPNMAILFPKISGFQQTVEVLEICELEKTVLEEERTQMASTYFGSLERTITPKETGPTRADESHEREDGNGTSD